MKVFVSWIGHTDLLAMSPSLPPAMREKLAEIVHSTEPPEGGGNGPVRAILDKHQFDRVHLLSNYPNWVHPHYISWLGHPVDLHLVPLRDPTDYAEIFEAVEPKLKEFTAERPELSIGLSSGTPAMAAIWLLLGKSKYPARFHQTYRGKVVETKIPFDLTVDYVPELLHRADSRLQRLAGFSPQEVEGFQGVIGNSQAICLAVGRAKKAAMRDVSVLLTGESGTGKEMFARAIHAASPRRDKPLLAVNCAAIPGHLMESELFGHEKGAFTGADRKVRGAFERANGGTLFLDEIGELSIDLQAKLLRALQPPLDDAPCSREIYSIGSSKPLRVDVRVVAATNRDLPEMISSRGFRNDLYYRLAAITIKLPPLRDRRADIRTISESLVERINQEFGKGEPGYRPKNLTAAAMSLITRHSWAGNVRELHNALLQSAVMCDGEEIGVEDLEAAITEIPFSREATVNLLDLPLGAGFVLEDHMESIRRHYIERAMREAVGVKAKAARLLGIKNYQTLDGQLRRLGIDVRPS